MVQAIIIACMILLQIMISLQNAKAQLYHSYVSTCSHSVMLNPANCLEINCCRPKKSARESVSTYAQRNGQRLRNWDMGIYCQIATNFHRILMVCNPFMITSWLITVSIFRHSYCFSITLYLCWWFHKQQRILFSFVYALESGWCNLGNNSQSDTNAGPGTGHYIIHHFVCGLFHPLQKHVILSNNYL